MLDFSSVRNEETNLAKLAQGLTTKDLERLTNEMVDHILSLIEDCQDGDVIFIPQDPEAYDKYAATEEEIHMAWTLGHVIVHITASSEEAAALAAELARGVPYHGRSRYEVPWEKIKTIQECRQRMEESRRMCLASLGMWPDRPHMGGDGKAGRGSNAVVRFLAGLMHTDSHLGQIEDIVSQAAQARQAEPG